MAVITFDTLEYSKNLEAKGFTTEQAEALAIENKRVFNEFAETQLATKADLLATENRLKTDIRITHWGIGLLLLVIGIPALKTLFMG